MPTIITTHITKVRRNSAAVQGENIGAMIMAGMLLIPGVCMRLSKHQSTQTQASVDKTSVAASTSAWSRRRSASSAVSRLSVDDAMIGEIEFAELPVSVGKLEIHRRARFRPAPPDFGELVFEPIGVIDAHPMLG